MDSSHILLFESVECTTPEANSTVNYEVCVIMTCQCRFTNCDKDTTLVRDVDNGDAMHVHGARGLWEISVFSSQFCCEPTKIL